MQIPSKYIFFIKERIRESTIFLRKTTLSDHKKNTNLNDRINFYKKKVKEQNEIINKIKNESSALIAYDKSEEIKLKIKNNGEVVKENIEKIRTKNSDLKIQLKQINTSIDKKKSKDKDVQGKIIILRDEIEAQEKSNVVLKDKLKEKSIKAKKNKKELIDKNKIIEKKALDKQPNFPPSNGIIDEFESLHSFSVELINDYLELDILTEARKIFLILMASESPEKIQNEIGGDVFINNTSNNLADFGKILSLNIKDKQNRIEKKKADNASLENEVTGHKLDLLAMEEINSRNSGDSLGGANFFVSFSDIISVLLCFFILFFTISALDGEKAKQLTSTYVKKITKKVTFNAYVTKEELEMLEKVKELILDNVKPDAIIGSKTITIKHVISGADLFEPGKAGISEEGVELLMQKLKNDLTGEVLQVLIEGHTDDQELLAFPESLKKYESNTRLSAARSVIVAKIIEESFDLSENIIGVRAYGSNRPLKPNASDLLRALNRRVVVIIKKDRKKEITKDDKKVDDNTLVKKEIS